MLTKTSFLIRSRLMVFDEHAQSIPFVTITQAQSLVALALKGRKAISVKVSFRRTSHTGQITGLYFQQNKADNFQTVHLNFW